VDHAGRRPPRPAGHPRRRRAAAAVRGRLDAAARATIASLDPTPFFQKYGPTGNAWAIFKTYLDAAARLTADPIITKYTGRLAGADVFTTDNAFAMIESLRIDSGDLGPFGVR